MGLKRGARIVNMCVDSIFSGIRLSEVPLKIPYTSHTRLHPHIVNSFSFKDQHARRVKNFLDTFTSSKNMHVLIIGEHASRNTIGALGHNRARIEIYCNGSKSNYAQIISPTEGVSEFMDLLGNARQIHELIDAWMESRNTMVSHMVRYPR